MRLSPIPLGTRPKSFLTHCSPHKLPHSSLSSKHQMQFLLLYLWPLHRLLPVPRKSYLALSYPSNSCTSLDLKTAITYQVNSIHPSTPQQSHLSLQYVLTMPRPNTIIKFIKLVHCKYLSHSPALHLEIPRVRLNTTVPSSVTHFSTFPGKASFSPICPLSAFHS